MRFASLLSRKTTPTSTRLLKNPRRQHERSAAHADIQERTRAPGAENPAALAPVLKFTRQKVDAESVDEGAHRVT